MFISRSLGPKKRSLGSFCLEPDLISAIGRMTIRFALVRRKRWKKEMTMPDENSAVSAARALPSAASKSSCMD